MRRKIGMALMGLLVAISAMAEVLTEEQARRIALDFRSSGTRSVHQPTLVYTGMAQSTGTRSVGAPAFYIYNYGKDNGFVIVSGEDSTLPVLAFSDTGQFVVGEAMPVQVNAWLQGYCDYIRQVRSGARSLESAPDLGVDITIAVEPLVKAQWDQLEPYNNLCPPYDFTENCATGCVATAMAQIMKHHNWPDVGEGSVMYDDKLIDFSQSRYDWDNMLDVYSQNSYTQKQGDAVAKLMYDVGVSTEMLYGYESGAQNVYAYRSLYTYFKYSKQMQYLVRNTMTTAEWKNRIRKELDAGRPVYYGGFAEDMTMGHAFVCDGIDESNNYFHFNWGWSGYCNGYYFLNALNPPIQGVGGGMGNFNADHIAIVGIQPAVEGEADSLNHSVLLMRKGFFTNTTSTSLGRNFYAQISNLWNLGPEKAYTHFAVAMYKDGQFVQRVSQLVELNVGAFVGFNKVSIPVSIPKETAEGEYELRCVCGNDTEGWKEVLYYYDCYQRVIGLTVEGNIVKLSSASQSGVKLQAELQQPLPTTVLPGKKYVAQIDFENQGWVNFDGRVGCRLLQLPQQIDGPQFDGSNADTLLLSQEEDYQFIYSEDAKALSLEYRLSAPANYLLQAYYVDPLSYDEVLAGEWPLTLEQPAQEYSRRVVAEFDIHREESADLFDLADVYANRFIPIGLSGGDYKDSLLSISVNGVTVDRRGDVYASSSATQTYRKVVEDILSVPAVASIGLKARYASSAKDSVAFSFSSVFAYAVEGADMRFSLLAVESDQSVENLVRNVALGFYPTDAFGGMAGSIPDSIEVGENYEFEYICPVEVGKPDMFFVALLIDGETGEICNAVSLSQKEIAPMDGEAHPESVTIERSSIVMNTGLSIELSASVSPAIASQELVWTSSDSRVASFDQDGKLHALNAGTAVVRVASAVDETVYAEVQVTVQKADYAQPQKVEAGYLHYLVDFGTCPDKLILSGEINGTDIALLRYLSGGNNINEESGIGMPLACPLSSLDISECRIVAGGKPYYKNFVTENDVVGKEMFKWCLFLNEIKLPNTVTTIGDNAFYRVGRADMVNIEIPASVVSIGYASFYGCQEVEGFVVAEGNPAFKAVDGVLYNYAGTELVAYPVAKQAETYEAIETLNRILPYAFGEARYLKVFQGNLRLSSIGYGAFYNAWELDSVSLSSRLNAVGEYAFAGCSSLMHITCQRSTPAECAANAFEGVPEECVLHLPDNYDEEYYTAPGWSQFAKIQTSVDELRVEDAIRVYPVVGGLKICGATEGESVSVYSPTGILLKEVSASGDDFFVPMSASGIYIIRMSGFNAKVVIK